MSVLPSPVDLASGALVSKVDPVAHTASYLLVTDGGALEWVGDPCAATPFASMREAARMAVRLPSGQRAFGVPAEHP